MDIAELVKGYEPSENARQLVADTAFVLLCGITGAGKDAIKGRILERDRSFYRIITSTTRAPRDNDGIMEQHGREYYFYTLEQAAQMIADKRYFEVAKVHDRINGVTIDEIKRIHDAGKTAIGDVDYQGVEYFHRYAPSVKTVFITPPNYQTWYQRLSQRYDSQAELEEALPVRMHSAIRELEWALKTPYLDFVINDELEQACHDVARVAREESGPYDGRTVAQELLTALVESQKPSS